MIDLPSQDLALIKAIFAQHAPQLRVRVFGSRVSGGALRYSDIDLALEDATPIGRQRLATLQEIFSASRLPITVDLVDLNCVDKQFRDYVLANGEPLIA